MLVNGRPFDGQQQVAEVFGQPLDGSRVGLAEQPLLGTVRTYAGDVAPAVRELVGAGRRSSASPHGDGPDISSTRLWDEAARPAGPRATAVATHTPAGRAASAELVAVHNMLRQELADIRDLIMQVQKGVKGAGQARSELNQMTMRQNNWTMGAYCQSYCRVVTQHHSAEDVAVFPYLRAREPALGLVLDRLHEEHVIIHGPAQRHSAVASRV